MSKKIKVKLDTVNLQEEGYHLFIKGEIGKHPVRLLIDTGASTTVIDKNFLSEKFPDLSLAANEQLTTGVGTNTIQSEFTELADMNIGKLKLHQFKVAVLDLKHVNETYGIIELAPIQGVVGCDLLVEYGAVINLKKHRIKLKANRIKRTKPE